MALAAPTLLVRVALLQMLGAFVMVITGILDRVQVKDRVIPFPLTYIVMPLWTGILVLITASIGVVVGAKLNITVNSPLVITYRTLNIFCSILCGFILYWYGTALYTYAQLAYDGPVEDSDSFAVVAIIFVMALIKVFLSIMGLFASGERNSTYMQLVDPPIATYHDQAGEHVPLNQVPGSNFSRSGQMQGGFQTQAVATAYQPMPHTILQVGNPVMMAPPYLNQMGAAKALVMLVPVENMQQMPGASGNGLMYVQVPANQVLSGSTQENTSSQVPQVTTYPSGPLSSEDMQGTI